MNFNEVRNILINLITDLISAEKKKRQKTPDEGNNEDKSGRVKSGMYLNLLCTTFVTLI